MTTTITGVPGVTRATRRRDGGGLRAYLPASYDRLVELFGPPDTGDEYKVSSEWRLEFEGVQFALYDYKETNLYSRSLPSVEAFRRRPVYDWHVGSTCDGIQLQRFLEAVRRAL